MTDHAVVVAGGGPTGLMLAAELALAGVDAAIVERRTDQHVEASRAGGLHARTLEVLDQRGVAERFVEAGERHPGLAYAGTFLDLSDFPSRHNYVLALFQSAFEPILADWVAELEVPIRRGSEVVGFTQDDSGVDVKTSGGGPMRAQYLVGCDGGHSLVRRHAGIDFVGSEPSTSWMIAEARMDDPPEPGIRYDDAGTQAIGPAADGTSMRIVMTEHELHTGTPDIEELRDRLRAVHGTDFGLRSASWISRFTDVSRQAASYRNGRVLLAGDAAHVHPPHGGQGLNTGVQDAVNLGWKLAQVVSGASPDDLLDTYHDERHPVGARVLHNAMAQVALSSGGERHQALRDTVADLLTFDGPRRQIAGMLSGLDITYELGGEHPMVGRRMPDLDLDTPAGPTRVFTLLHGARAVLIDFEGPAGATIPLPADRVRVVSAGHGGPVALPVLGEVPRPPAVLIRPDGHVAWAGPVSDPELSAQLARWCGSASTRE